jgi:catechol 2,3-dioxygenase-like lactoylglutathione lyase family enzyme
MQETRPAENAQKPQQKLKGISPSFLVDDVVKSAEFYRDILGFTFDRYWGDPPCFVILVRDFAEISLGNPGAPGLMRPNRKAHPEAAWDAYIWVEDVEALHREFIGKVKIIRGPDSTFYNTREIEVEDCNGYVLCFGQDTSGESG